MKKTKSKAKPNGRTPRKHAAGSTRASSRTEPSALDPRLAVIARAFAKDARVTSGGKGFGSGALKVNGKIFAMISSRGTFVVKLAQPRVSELVAGGQGSYFDSGKGKPMKEWLALEDQEEEWLALAKEAHAFVLRAENER